MRQLAFLLAAPTLCLAVTIGEVNTFEAGLEGWTVALGPGGGVADPSWAPTTAAGAEGGPTDDYLWLRSTGTNGAGSRLTAMTETDWIGNYLSAGVNAISMKVRNLGGTDLTLRLALETLPPMAPPSNVAVSTVGINLPAGSGWMNVLFPLTPGSLTALEGTALGALSDVDVLRIFHNPTADFPPETISASLGVDDITALAIPEPSTLFLTGVALVALSRRRLAG